MECNRKHFTAFDICKIVKACADGGVTRFKLGDLEVEFPRPVIDVDLPPSLRHASPEEILEQNIISERTAAYELLRENQKHEDGTLDTLILSDSEEYERMMTGGEIEDEEA